MKQTEGNLLQGALDTIGKVIDQIDLKINMNSGDIYALMAAFCWSSGIILFQLSGKVLDSLQINLLKNLIMTQNIMVY